MRDGACTGRKCSQWGVRCIIPNNTLARWQRDTWVNLSQPPLFHAFPKTFERIVFHTRYEFLQIWNTAVPRGSSFRKKNNFEHTLNWLMWSIDKAKILVTKQRIHSPTVLISVPAKKNACPNVQLGSFVWEWAWLENSVYPNKLEYSLSLHLLCSTTINGSD